MTMRPYSLNISRIKCHSTNDYTGSDDLVGVMGPVRFPIGSFTPGNDYNLDINQVVPAGEFYLNIIETDLSGDDEIGMIDLSAIMDFQTVKNVQGADASYDITILVQSVSD
ncbi:hypothetical protein NKI56_05785 [Mesorhizobium sp. M0622]|uniref:hypothetical protein n=1 Tax=unclassified Mesorhizobium TaxID=325217 RepID=UPI003336F323